MKSARKVASTASRTSLADSLPFLLGDKTPRSKSSGRKKPPSAKSTIKRVDIISEKLCDDVISYLAPTLQQHRGCTLLDFDPGVCLFSRKLHDFLQPKQHILIEQEKVYYDPFIKPLLNLPGSTYRHAIIPSLTHPSLRWNHDIRTKYDPLLLPERKPLPSEDPRRMQFDPSVLVIGNLARRAGQRRVGASDQKFDLERLVLFAMFRDLLAKSGFFEAGLIRMLWWLPDSSKGVIIPPNVANNRTAFSLGLDMAFDVSEVAGVKHMSTILNTSMNAQRKRLQSLDDVAANAVAERMKKNGPKVPKGRALQSGVEKEDLTAAKKKKATPPTTPASISPFASLAQTIDELNLRINAVSTRLAELTKWAATIRISYSSQETEIRHALSTLAYPQCAAVSTEAVQRKPVKADTSKAAKKALPPDSPLRGARNTVLLDLGLRILNLEASYHHLATTSPLPKQHKQILTLDKNFRTILIKAGDRVVRDVGELLEDQLAAYTDPPLMSWDRRACEPLQIDPSETYPMQEIALLDFHPKSLDLSVPDLASSAETSKLCTQLLTALLATKKQSLPVTLDRIAVNAAKDLIPMVHAITDVRKGGRLSASNVKARMLTGKMVGGLVGAWFEWPFRPKGWELELAAGEVVAAEKEVERREDVE